MINFIFKKIPHKHIYQTTRYNGINHAPNEKKCWLCGRTMHLSWESWLKSGDNWKEGTYDSYLDTLND